MVPPVKPPAAAPGSPAPPKARQGFSFHELLSELNPLQYLPVIGTIYRAVTGDAIPEAARIAGSMVVSGLMGGPVGLAMTVGTTALEKLTGIDPERIGQRLLTSLGIAHAKTAPAPATPSTKPWSPTQRAAYGITRTPDGALRRGELQGAELLNALELQRLHITA